MALLRQPLNNIDFDATTCVEAIRRNSPEWETALVSHFLPRIRIYTQRVLPNHPAVEDVIQDCLWAAIQALREGRLTIPANLAPFVFSIAKHRVMDVHRQEARTRTTPLTDQLTRDAIFETDRTAEDQQLIAQEAIGQLPQIDRQILSLLLISGLNYSQISDKLKLEVAAIRQRKSRALRRLSEKLSQSAGRKRLS